MAVSDSVSHPRKTGRTPYATRLQRDQFTALQDHLRAGGGESLVGAPRPGLDEQALELRHRSQWKPNINAPPLTRPKIDPEGGTNGQGRGGPGTI